ncbi:hypothetical protein H9Q10_05060 [Eikenella sp. S3360]|uniref:Uncharacterized protein n=1 Tax=Eikenella glucosivorans TaxID=2766967 RepID=A0ABS0N9Q3_9NEIS|nr:hypothetical protein [Eikenella glucosivorans]MBH5329037.1 hypothetical protein [Eikenella glucosivorans]
MQHFQFPLQFYFKIFTPSNDFSVLDEGGQEIAYTRQKIFKLKEEVEIFRSADRRERLYRICADRIIDFNACYRIFGENGAELGSVRRDGMRSLWRVRYRIFGADGQPLYQIQEKNPWIAFWDGLVGEIPLIGAFSGYFLNPSYEITDAAGQQVYLLKKEPSLVGRRFSLSKTGTAVHDELVVLSLMMLMLLERSNG